MSERRWDAAALNDLAQVMRDASICGLGQAAPNPLVAVLKYFPEDVAKRSEPGGLTPDGAPADEPPPGGEERTNL
jgi:formate dehydrogenase